MKIEQKDIPVRELVAGYANNDDEGVVGYGGRLDIRPKYQREFVYDDRQRDAVINTVRRGFPLNVMYWADNGDGRHEVIDGQQRILSICQYCGRIGADGKRTGMFSIPDAAGMDCYFHSLAEEAQAAILDYQLMVYFCRGSAQEKLDWFQTINIAGERLSAQELRNAVYSGPWVSDAKKYFSKAGCPAYTIGGQYADGDRKRQELLETAIKWHCGGAAGIEDYMSARQHHPSAEPLWDYFDGVIRWVKKIFPKHRKEMKGLPWGDLHREFGGAPLDPVALEAEVARLMEDGDVTAKRGVYLYVLDKQEKHLSIRAFTPTQKRTVFERQREKCKKCGKRGDIAAMHADHITPWRRGGRTVEKNCQVLCAECNREKSDI